MTASPAARAASQARRQRGRRPGRRRPLASRSIAMYRCRSSIVLVAMIVAVASLAAQTPSPGQVPAAPAAPGDQPPVFRAGVEVLPLDVTVLDRDGRQIVDLTVAEFIGGSGRQAAQGRLGRIHQAHRRAGRRHGAAGTGAGRRRAAAARLRHLDQRRRRPAGSRHPAAGRSGQHPLRRGAAGDAERPEVRRSPAAERPARPGRRFPAPANWSTSRPITARCAKRCCG